MSRPADPEELAREAKMWNEGKQPKGWIDAPERIPAISNNPFDHCCGLQGFGRSLHDLCPACHYWHLTTREGMEPEKAIIQTKIDDYKSSAALFPHLRKFCLARAAELEQQM